MSSSYSRPAWWRRMLVFLLLLMLVVYGIYHSLRGDNGRYAFVALKKEKQLIESELEAIKLSQSRYRHLLDLYKSHQLDPDIIEEQARALLMMANSEDLIIIDKVPYFK